MGKGKYRSLSEKGVLNVVEYDLGTIVSARQSLKSLAVCSCGHVEENVFKIDCVKCGHALYWESLPQKHAEEKLRRHYGRAVRHTAEAR